MAKPRVVYLEAEEETAVGHTVGSIPIRQHRGVPRVMVPVAVILTYRDQTGVMWQGERLVRVPLTEKINA